MGVRTTILQRAKASAVALCLTALSGGLIQCGGGSDRSVAHPGDRSGTAPSLQHQLAQSQAESLLFPPPLHGDRRPRPPLSSRFARHGVSSQLRVVEPLLDGDRSFHVRGKTLRVRFSHPIVGAAVATPAGGLLRLRPAVAGHTRWADEYTVEFTASQPFAAKTRYELELAKVETRGGRALEQPFVAKFTATPLVVVAGKQLDYVPTPGEYRAIRLWPDGGATVGRQPLVAVLYDQPVDLSTARELVGLADQSGLSVPAVLAHPPTDRFDGVPVDRRLVVILRAARPLMHGESLRLVAKDRSAQVADQERVSRFSIAPPLSHRGVECERWQKSDDHECRLEGDLLRTSTRQVHVRFNNPIATATKRLRQHVRVTPAVRNLTVQKYGWSDGLLSIAGDFRASKRYRVVVAGLVDRYGSRQRAAVALQVEVPPLGASVAMPEGLILLDPARSAGFPLTSRNVEEAELLLWPVERDDTAAFRAALEVLAVPAFQWPAPLRVPVPVAARRDELVDTEVDLTSHLDPHTSYLATVRPSRHAFGASATRYPRGSEASRPPVALLRVGTAQSLAVHTHRVGEAVLVHVARLHSGEPVSAAAVTLVAESSGPTVETDAHGVALLVDSAAAGSAPLLKVQASGVSLLVPLARKLTGAAELFPHLTRGERSLPTDVRSVMTTDRGIYRPGASVNLKANVFRPQDADLRPFRGQLVRARLLGPAGDVVASGAGITGQLGGLALNLAVPTDTKLGRHQLLLEDPMKPAPPLAKAVVQIAAFEPPRFAVDVHVDGGASQSRLRALVRGRYLFGAAMTGASAQWSVRRQAAPFPAGPLTSSGLRFRPQRRWSDERSAGPTWARTGSGVLDGEGALPIDEPLNMVGVAGPQRFDIEADVSDSSYRHVAGHAVVIKHPAPRYVGIDGPRGWVDVGKDVAVELGVIDTTGAPVVGAKATARMHRIEWRLSQSRVEGGALRARWTVVRTPAGRCSVATGVRAKSCRLPVSRPGDYEVSAEIDGRSGGRISFWAWRDGDRARAPAPTRGSVVQVATDKARYAPGDTARLLVRNPYPAATAIVTTQAAGLLTQRSERVEGPAAVIDLPLSRSHAPHVHATVTLLPIGARGDGTASHRIGAVRLPVSLEDAKLDLGLQTDRPSYEPGDEAEITLTLKDGGRPESNGEIALAVVDEGVLRLTNFTAPDPVRALHPGRPLEFRVTDTRDALRELLERSHVAGGGGSGEAAPVTQGRSNFVKTALWRPSLRTDGAGRATVRFRLPDNLTEFRIMAVAVDDEGKGARGHHRLTVRKPVMLAAVVPRFAIVGDRFEVAALAHNTAAQPFHGVVRFGDKVRPVSIAAGGRERVAFEVAPKRPGPLDVALSVANGDGELDRVLRRIEVQQPGMSHRPRLTGTFVGDQQIELRLPGDMVALEDDALIIKVGQHLWPELGARLEFLLDYPHGCVEQTTSSTLPLIAARDILPRIGVRKMTDLALTARIRAGLERLASMQTASGGLAYWPGGTAPNVYGTAYAMRAVVRASDAGVEPPAGLRAGMTGYLGDRLLDEGIEPEVRAAIAQSLAERGKLPASAADALFDLADRSSVFGQASLALALSHLAGQQARVAELLDRVEAAFDGEAHLKRKPRGRDFSYFGSPQRSKAQAAMALGRLRKSSPLHPRIVSELARQTGSYTTQATAYGLLAVADHLRSVPDRGAGVSVSLDDQALSPERELGTGSQSYRIALSELRGVHRALRLHSNSKQAIAYQLEARYRRPLPTASGDEPFAELVRRGRRGAPAERVATSGRNGPDLYRAYANGDGAPVDLSSIAAGSVVRVALLIQLPEDLPAVRRGYLAVTDRLPAGFEPVDPDLATVARAPSLSDEHPFAQLLRSGGNAAAHIQLHDDRVQIYFDRVQGNEVVATYLARATTPGHFVLPPAQAELMYEADSLSYSEAARVVVR